MQALLLLAAPCVAALGAPVWHEASSIGVGGRGFPTNTGNATYFRLPPSAQGVVPPAVWFYGTNSAGLFVQFETNAATISTRYQLTTPNTTVFSNFPPTGFSGIDLYRYDDGNASWRWVATSFEGLNAAKANNWLILDDPLVTDTVGWPVGPASPYPTLNSTHRYRLHFPSYNGVTSLAVGVPEGATLTPDLSWAQGGTPPVLYYGTSITQGGLTPRPGDTYVNRLSRTLPVPVLNLGFCGSCRMELSVASFLVQIPTSVFVIDCGHNMGPALIANNTEPFVKAVRAAIPASVPIVLVEPSDYRPSWIQTDNVYNVSGRRAELRAAYERLTAAGVGNLQYVFGPALYAGADSVTEELAMEGVHPLDRGHRLIFEAMIAVLLPLVQAATASAAATGRTSPEQGWPVQSREGGEAGSAGVPATVLPPPGFVPDLVHGLVPAVRSRGDRSKLDSVVFTDARSLTIRGRAFPESDLPGPYTRLPTAAHGVVRDQVWDLSLASVGIQVGFQTDSPDVWINYTALTVFEPMAHFAVCGMSGVDLWAYDESTTEWRFAATSNLDYGTQSALLVLNPPGSNLTNPSGTPRKYVAYLPTYNGAVSLAIGVDAGHAIAPFDPLPPATAAKPVVWYGTSILQGGVTLKVGNVFTHRVSRGIKREIYNFGFSGNGKMELSVAQFIAPLDASAFIIDCLWNMSPELVSNNTLPLVAYIRANAPGGADVPIFLAEGTPFGRDWAVGAVADNQAAISGALLAAYQTLVSAGDTHVHYVRSGDLFSPASTLDSATAAGLHSTDAGIHDVAAAWIPLLHSVLGGAPLAAGPPRWA